MHHPSIDTTRTNNDNTTEMYMALFEMTISDCAISIDLSTEQVGGRWIYKNHYTSQLYDTFIQGHMQATDNMMRMGTDAEQCDFDMWEMSGELVKTYIKRLQQTS